MKDVNGRFTRRDWLALGAGLAAGCLFRHRAACAPDPGAQRSGGAGLDSQGRAATMRIWSRSSADVRPDRRHRHQVQGKTVAIKVNLTGGNRFEGYTAGETHWVHPSVVGAVTAVLGKLGAKRIRILESAGSRRPDSNSKTSCCRADGM